MATTYLSKTLGTPTDNKKWTFSAWVKKAHIGSDINTLFGAGGSSTNFASIWVNYNNGQIQFQSQTSGGVTGGSVRLLNLLRDVAAWYHLVVSFDSANSTAADRVKIYINGIRGTNFDGTPDYPNLNIASFINSNIEHTIGKDSYRSAGYYDGSMANVEFVDGQAYDPTYFGSFNSATGIWTPSGATAISNYGTNGFKLKMDTTSPGADTSGKGNTFTASGSPTLLQGNPQNNWCTLNPNDVLRTNGGIQVPTFSNGNTTMASSSNVSRQTFGTIGVETGKFYWETKITVANSTGHRVGVFFGNNKYDGSNPYYYGANAFYIHQNGQIYYNGSSTTYMASYTAGDIISVALDRTNGQIYLSKNGGASDSTWANGSGANNSTFANAVSISTKLGVTMPSNTTQPFFDIYGTGNTMSVNFGSPSFAISSGNADGNGFGNFEYTVPTGYFSLNTKNLSEALS